MTNAVNLKVLDNGVALVTIDLVGSKMNLLSEVTLRELSAAVDAIEANPAVRGVVIISGKDDNFGAGANVEEIKALQSQPAIKIYEAVSFGKALFARIEKLNSVAAIHGISLGGFTELALACKYRIATNDEKTQIGVPEVQLGFIPGWGGTVRMPLLIGLMPAFELISTGKNVSSHKAWRLGLIDETVAHADLAARAAEIALAGNPKRYKPALKEGLVRSLTKAGLEGNSLGRKLFANMAGKQVMAQTKGKYPAPLEALKVCLIAVSASRETAFEAESQAFARLACSETSKTLVGIFFGQTESKKMPAGVKPNIDVKEVGVIGAGVMGAGIAQSALYKGYTVVLKDIDQKALDKGVETIKGLFAELVSRGKLSQTEVDVILSGLKPTLKYEDMKDCDMVIEAVVEIMKVKKIVRSELEKVITKPFIFATNTSSLSVSEMADGARHPELVVGIHFFNPVHKMPLVEIVAGKTTSNESLACAKTFAMKLGKTTVTTNDAPGFVVNRILAPYMREAIVMAEEGVPMADIERAALSFGMKMGPFTLLDEVGLDIAGHVINTLHKALGDRMSPPAILKTIESLKLLGRKGNKGIYLYNEKGDRKFVMEGKRFGAKKKRFLFNPDVEASLPQTPKKKSMGEIQDRLFLAMAAEAALCMQEGVIDDASQLDLAMIFGTGFPPFVGGPLRYMDSMGTALAYQKLAYLSKVAGDNYKPCDLLKEKGTKGEKFRKN
jgi:3-hydroxyacyl-CoA dehydrogenase